MTRRTRISCVIFSATVLCAAAARADDVAAAEKQIIENWQKLRSARAKETLSETTEAKGNRATQEGSGTFEFLRDGERILSRQETRSQMKLAVGEQNLTFEFASLIICDGKYTYELSERLGKKTARKTRPDPLRPADVKTLLETLKNTEKLKLLDEQTVGGQKACVVEAAPKTESAGRPYKTIVYYFSQDHGVLLRQEARDAQGKVIRSTEFSDFEYDVKLDPDDFRFKAPEGVTVQDLTGGEEPSRNPSPPKGKAASPPPEAPQPLPRP